MAERKSFFWSAGFWFTASIVLFLLLLVSAAGVTVTLGDSWLWGITISIVAISFLIYKLRLLTLPPDDFKLRRMLRKKLAADYTPALTIDPSSLRIVPYGIYRIIEVPKLAGCWLWQDGRGWSGGNISGKVEDIIEMFEESLTKDIVRDEFKRVGKKEFLEDAGLSVSEE